VRVLLAWRRKVGSRAPSTFHRLLCMPALPMWLVELALTPSPCGLPRCWGWNGRGGYNAGGVLGLGNWPFGTGLTDAIGDEAGEVASLADVDLGGTVMQLAAGSEHTCALLDDGLLCVPRPLPRPCMGCFSLI